MVALLILAELISAAVFAAAENDAEVSEIDLPIVSIIYLACSLTFLIIMFNIKRKFDNKFNTNETDCSR